MTEIKIFLIQSGEEDQVARFSSLFLPAKWQKIVIVDEKYIDGREE